jgi:hypothetical protein
MPRCYIYNITIPGDLVAMHRKVHLFDIDIPGKIRFKVNPEAPKECLSEFPLVGE